MAASIWTLDNWRSSSQYVTLQTTFPSIWHHHCHGDSVQKLCCRQRSRMCRRPVVLHTLPQHYPNSEPTIPRLKSVIPLPDRPNTPNTFHSWRKTAAMTTTRTSAIQGSRTPASVSSVGNNHTTEVGALALSQYANDRSRRQTRSSLQCKRAPEFKHSLGQQPALGSCQLSDAMGEHTLHSGGHLTSREHCTSQKSEEYSTDPRMVRVVKMNCCLI